MCYRGHPEGAKEAAAVKDFVEVREGGREGREGREGGREKGAAFMRDF
jgi:hypothetical protein